MGKRMHSGSHQEFGLFTGYSNVPSLSKLIQLQLKKHKYFRVSLLFRWVLSASSVAADLLSGL